MHLQVSDSNIVVEARMLCKKMRRDLDLLPLLQKRYPGVIRMFYYEDLVLNPNQTIRDIYSHFDSMPPDIVFESVASLMNDCAGKEGKENPFEQNRSDPKKSLVKWAFEVSEEEVDAMTAVCSEVLKELGYPVYVNQAIQREEIKLNDS